MTASCFADGTGWMYVSNAELSSSAGDASAVRFGPSVSIADAYRIRADSTRNCAGGATSWNTWLSCEETCRGYVDESDP